MTKMDLKRAYRDLYATTPMDVTIVEAPPLHYLMIDGQGDPNTSPDYAAASAALFATSYAIKFAVKRATGTDFGVMPLEGLWWLPDGVMFDPDNKAALSWTAMILQPDLVTAALVDATLAEVARKKDLPAITRIRLAPLHEGTAAQIVHTGPFAEEIPTVEKLHEFIARSGYCMAGKHHEIYASDPRRTPPERLKTIIRYPVRAA